MDDALKTFHIGKTFGDNKGNINALDFHRSEDLVVSAGDDESIHLYNTATGAKVKTVMSKRYGVACISFTHDPKYFKGHRDRVVGVSMSPKNDTFMSASLDKTIRFWDLRNTACQGLLQTHCSGHPCAAYDQQGLVFAVSTGNVVMRGLVVAVSTEDGLLKLYDVRSFEKGPFTTFHLQPTAEGKSPPILSSLMFSYDGWKIFATSPGCIQILDAYKGTCLHTIHRPEAPSMPPQNFDISISPDDQYVISGCPDYTIRAWRVSNGTEAACWSGLSGLATVVKWAPRRKLVASGDTEGKLALWVPTAKPPTITTIDVDDDMMTGP
eukprot:gene20115-24079_t